MKQHRQRGPLISAGVLVGAGLGGFVDGILLHQILQWHNLLSSKVAPIDLVSMKYNMVWDGIFHAFTWLMTAVGLALLWRAGHNPRVPWSTRTFCGALSLGWGLFNVVEGILDHHVLGMHHVRPGANEVAWDVAFLIFGAVLIVGGILAIRRGRSDTATLGDLRMPPGARAHHV